MNLHLPPDSAAGRARRARRTLLLFTKPPVPGRVKTRLIGPLSAVQAAELHGAFLGDLAERLAGAPFELVPVWALEDGGALPTEPPGGCRQIDGDLGARMRHAFSGALPADGQPGSRAHAVAIGSDLPQLEPERILAAFAALEGGADVVLGPARDGGYYLIGLGAEAFHAPIFEGIAWSTDAVLQQTLERCRVGGLAVTLLPEEEDIDTVQGLARFAGRLAAGGLSACPRVSALLEAWGGFVGPDGDLPGVEGPCVS